MIQNILVLIKISNGLQREWGFKNHLLFDNMYGKACSLIPKAVISGCRFISTPSRRLITKGIVSPMNSYPPTMMVPEYVKTGVDEGTVGKKTILTDYVGT